MRVEDVMTSQVHTCTSNCSLNDATRSMWEHDVGALPVLDDGGRPIAMITDRDACMAAFTRGQRLDEIQVHSAMSKGLFTCHKRDELDAAERTMRVHQLRRLPVIDEEGRLAGLVSLADIVQARMRSPVARASERLLAEAAVTLASICRPRMPALPPGAVKEDTWNPFEIQNSPAFRETAAAGLQSRAAPARFSGALSRLHG